MSQQHQKWVDLVEQRLKEKNWTKADLTQAVGLRSQGTITDLLTKGKGSADLKLRVSKLLGIREPWEEFEEK
ncbi:TPA: transcriptional regulator [Streptococcus suis]|uniref:transcriptional regulator n=1 Tax=Streptococcus suis TaxID=1307 RepID=UPI0029B6B5C2|nr:transcriptional regulator [Streptococcus suis]HEM4323019.1 transcriptional regulator [Streptococcus suis]